MIEKGKIILLITSISVMLSSGCSHRVIKHKNFNYIIEDQFVFDFKEKKYRSYKIYLEYPKEVVKNGNIYIQKVVEKQIKLTPYFEGRFRNNIPYKIVEDRKFGNKFIYIEIPQKWGLKLEKLEIVARYKIYRTEFKKDALNIPQHFINYIDKIKWRKYLSSEKHAPLNKYYRNIATKVTASSNSDLEKLHSIYNYIANYGKYYKYDPVKLKPSGKGDANYCDQFGTGGCSDYHAYFQSLGRSLNIPTRMVTGTYLDPKNNGKDIDNGYHCWVEVYIPNVGWLPLDPSWGNYYSWNRIIIF